MHNVHNECTVGSGSTDLFMYTVVREIVFCDIPLVIQIKKKKKVSVFG